MMNDRVQPNLKKGIFLSLAASFFFCTTRILWHELQTTIPIGQILFMQNIIALACLCPSLFDKRPIWKSCQKKIHLVRSFSVVATSYFSLLALQSMSLVDVTILHSSSAFFIPVISFFWFKDQFPKEIWIATAIGFLGVALVLDPSWKFLQIGSIFAIGAAISAALGISAARNLNLLQEQPEKTLFYLFSIGALSMSVPTYTNWIHPTYNEWLLLFGTGLALIINHTLIIQSFKHASAAQLSPLSYSSIAFTAIFSWLFLNEPIDTESVIGSFLIALGGCLTYFVTKESGETRSNPPLSIKEREENQLSGD